MLWVNGMQPLTACKEHIKETGKCWGASLGRGCSCACCGMLVSLLGWALPAGAAQQPQLRPAGASHSPVQAALDAVPRVYSEGQH